MVRQRLEKETFVHLFTLNPKQIFTALPTNFTLYSILYVKAKGWVLKRKYMHIPVVNSTLI